MLLPRLLGALALFLLISSSLALASAAQANINPGNNTFGPGVGCFSKKYP